MRAALLVCVLSAFGLATTAEASGPWAEQFTSPFAAQIIGVLNGISTPPAADSATLTTVAGLNVGDPILVDANGGTTQFAATVTAVDVPNQRVSWAPAIASGVAYQNGFVQSAYALTYPQQSAIDAQGRIYTVDSGSDRVVVFNANGTVLRTLGSHGRIYDDASLGRSSDDGYGPCNPACPNNPGAMLGQFFYPSGIDVSADGSTLVVSDWTNQRIVVFQQDASGAIAATGGGCRRTDL